MKILKLLAPLALGTALLTGCSTGGSPEISVEEVGQTVYDQLVTQLEDTSVQVEKVDVHSEGNLLNGMTFTYTVHFKAKFGTETCTVTSDTEFNLGDIACSPSE